MQATWFNYHISAPTFKLFTERVRKMKHYTPLWQLHCDLVAEITQNGTRQKRGREVRCLLGTPITHH